MKSKFLWQDDIISISTLCAIVGEWPNLSKENDLGLQKEDCCWLDAGVVGSVSR